MLSLSSALAVAAFFINADNRHFTVHRVVLPTVHFIEKPFHRKKPKP